MMHNIQYDQFTANIYQKDWKEKSDSKIICLSSGFKYLIKEMFPQQWKPSQNYNSNKVNIMKGGLMTRGTVEGRVHTKALWFLGLHEIVTNFFARFLSAHHLKSFFGGMWGPPKCLKIFSGIFGIARGFFGFSGVHIGENWL